MNCTSAGEFGGNFGRVEEGSVRVGLPGAPGWTTIGVFGSAFCAETDSGNRQARATVAKILLRLRSLLMYAFTLSQTIKKTPHSACPPALRNSLTQIVRSTPHLTDSATIAATHDGAEDHCRDTSAASRPALLSPLRGCFALSK